MSFVLNTKAEKRIAFSAEFSCVKMFQCTQRSPLWDWMDHPNPFCIPTEFSLGGAIGFYLDDVVSCSLCKRLFFMKNLAAKWYVCVYNGLLMNRTIGVVVD